MTRTLPDRGLFIGHKRLLTPAKAGPPALLAMILSFSVVLTAPTPAHARQQTLELTGDTWIDRTPDAWRDAEGRPLRTDPVEPEDRAVLAQARRQLAENNPRGALNTIRPWIDANEFFDNPGLPEALLIRGDALTATGREWRALYDYERILREFPASDMFLLANEREYEIATRYLDGLRTRFLGMRIINAEDIGVELLIRIQERMPGSALAERAAIRLGDHFYDKREIALAADMYDIYLRNFPNGPNRIKAEKRRIYTSLARFKGPRYDASSLIDARLNIEDFVRRYPIEAQRTGINEGLLARIDESQAAQMLDTAEWYLQTKNYPAARLTMQRLILSHPLTFAAERARDFMHERGWEIPATPLNGENRDDIEITGSQPAERVETDPNAEPATEPTPEANSAEPRP